MLQSAKWGVHSGLLKVAVLCLGVGGLATAGLAYQGGTPAASGQEVVIKREALKLIDPQQYKVPIYLEPARTVRLSSPVASTVQAINIHLGQREGKGAEAFRLDNSRSVLLVKKARANLQAARAEKKIADSKKDTDLQAVADARIEAAQADVELADLDNQRLVIRMPFTAQILQIHANEGQAVRPGDPLASIGEVSKLIAEVPAEKSTAQVGGTIELNIEQHTIKAKIEAVLPLNPRFDALRDLGDELVSVVVAIDNLEAKYQARQSVYTMLQPTDPVVVVATPTVTGEPDGQRRVQVLRDQIVRNLPVRILGRIGTEKVYVSGKFREGDELIVQSSKPLADGTSVKALAEGAAPAGAAPARTPTAVGPAPAGAPKKASGGF